MICPNINLVIKVIRNNVITNDESGYAEHIITPIKDSDIDTTQYYIPNLYNLDSDASNFSTDSEKSIDINISHYAARRYRTNTAQKLEKISKENSKQKCLNINIDNINVNNYNAINLFHKQEPSKLFQRSGVSKCLQDLLISNDMRAFKNYAKFDCQLQEITNHSVKGFQIYYHLMGTKPSYQSLYVMIESKRNISELIGLSCWKYTKQNIQPSLSFTDVEHYSIHITEDNGEVDQDFPCLEVGEPVGKFGFKKLALVEHANLLISDLDIKSEFEFSQNQQPGSSQTSQLSKLNAPIKAINTNVVSNSPVKSFLDSLWLKQKKTKRRLNSLKKSKFLK